MEEKMWTLVRVLFAAVSVGIACATITQSYFLLWKPERYIIDRTEVYRLGRLQSAVRYLQVIGCFIGIGFMVFKGVEGALWFVPRSWTFETDEGEREWLVHGLAFTTAFIFSGILLEKLERLAVERMSSQSR